MIGIFSDAGARLAVTYNGLTLNNPADSPDNTYELNTVTPVAQYQQNIDPNPKFDGSLLGPVRRSIYVLRIDGICRAQSLAAFFEKIKALSLAFDPSIVYAANVAVDGAIALDFSTPTTDVGNYGSGLVPARYYARARSLQVPPISQFSGFAGFFSIEIMVPNPFRFSQSTYTLTGAGTADLSAGNAASYPILAITMAGAGSATYQISCGAKSLTLNLSGCVNTDVITVDMGAKSVKKNGVETQSLYVAGDWFPLLAVSNTVTYTNPTNATSVLTWRRAWTI